MTNANTHLGLLYEGFVDLSPLFSKGTPKMISHPQRHTAHNTSFYSTFIAMVGLAGCASESRQPPSWEEFRAHVYQEPDTGIFIVNGDEPALSDAGLREYYDRIDKHASATDQEGLGETQQGLAMIYIFGRVTSWSSSEALNLTYCISSASFGSNYANVVSAMNDAAASWEGTGANINFVHSSSLDASCDNTTGVIFNVRQTSLQPYLARSFFPKDPRYASELVIDTSVFGPISPSTVAGVLRHELGHILGFRHEQVRPESLGVCPDEADSFWRPLTAYDSASVMHYPQCNGTNGGFTNLTSKDALGARALYNTSNPIEQSEFFVRQGYLDVLRREPDAGGLAFNLNILQSCNGAQACLGPARVAVVRGMLESPENRAQDPELNPALPGYKTAFVTHCYTNFLQRQPEAAEIAFYLNYLNSTNDYNGVVNGFITSTEYRSRFGTY